MDQPIVRKQIGLLFLSTYKEWAGGTIYILNLIRALNLLDDSRKPQILLFYGFQSPMQDVLDIGYPYLILHQVNSPNIFKKLYFRVKRRLTGKSVFFKWLPEVVYPYNPKIFLGKPRIDWIPDFQEWHLPHMFSAAEIKRRKGIQSEIARNGGTVVFSSEDAQKDFEKFYPGHHCNLRLLRFASMLPEGYKNVDIKLVKAKFELEDPYFMSPNQFWKHKNHMVVLEAVTLLKSENLNFQIVFTGSQIDPRNKEYFLSLENYIHTQQIQRWVKFLGFIDRAEQLSLMANARAILQPSLFEGWSTVVEDTKALNQFIILSNINVHKEQINENVSFFDPHSPPQLADILRKTVLERPEIKFSDYSVSIRKFSEDVLNVLHP